MSDLVIERVAPEETYKAKAYLALKQAITNMDIYSSAEPAWLDERQLSERLGVSRTPVREALAMLEQEGFVKSLPRRGIIVVKKTKREIVEMVQAWAALESMAARLATENASDRELRDLHKFAMKHSIHAARAELEEYSEANIEFHQRILHLSGCSLLKTTADGLFVHMHAVRRRAMGEGDRATRSVVDHMEIIEALEARDADLASRLVREHTMKLHDHVRNTWIRLENPGPAKLKAK